MTPIRLSLAFLLSALATSAATVVIDASAPPPAVKALPFAAGGTAPNGHVLGVNDHYLLLDGKPWFPVMGEFHFARYPADEWENEILKMKAGGIQVVASYVFWIFHEEKQGQFEWSGQRDVHRFVDLCAKHGLYVWLRIGPWAHGEARNGGFPDWVVAAGPTRENNPTYLAAVEKFFNAIGQQVHGQLWKDGGPIVGVQLENEYHPANNGEAHMTKLLELARAAGLDAPFYTATGWDKAVIPTSPFLPVFGGYTEQFWSDSRTELPPNQNFFFSAIRAEDNVSYDLKPKDRAYHDRSAPYPYFTAEMGGGMAIAYHRRPVMQAADSTAAALVRLGSGVTLLGYYMYHGGTNPDAAGPVHESFTGWNAYNDLETKTYDFQAPLGEFGQMRDTYRTMRVLHLFLHDFGPTLAPMAAYFPAVGPRSLDDAVTPRVALRANGSSGFIFINSHQRSHPLPDHHDFQVTVTLGGRTISVPRQPVTLPSGTYTHWPVNLPVGAARLRSATAQLLCATDAGATLVFGVTRAIAPEFVFDAADGLDIRASRGRVEHRGDAIVVTGLTGGRDVAITVGRANAAATKIVLLPADDALDLAKLPLGGKERLILTHAASVCTEDRITLESTDAQDLRLAAYPALEKAAGAFAETATTGLFTEYTAPLPKDGPVLASVRLTQPAGRTEPVKVTDLPKRHVAIQPTDADFNRAAVWSIAVPESANREPALLRIVYQGDVARLYAGNRLLTDNFNRGTPLEFGTWRLTDDERRAGLTLKVLPLRRDAPIYIPHAAWPTFDANDEAVALESAKLVPLHRATLEVAR